MTDIDSAGLENAAASIRAQTGAAIYAACCDVSDAEQVTTFVSAAHDILGAPTTLVNSAGIARMGTVLDTTPEEWDLVFATNVRSVFLLCRTVIPLMRKVENSSIVNVASEAGLVGFREYAAYAASKAAIINLTRCLALDHASAGIRVNAVCPGSIDTPLLQQFFDAAPDPEAARAQDAANHPMGIGTADDIAAAVRYLASASARYVTGTALVVDGGYTAA